MDDDKSPVVNDDTTASDDILDVLSATEDEVETPKVEETQQDESQEDDQADEDETESEVEPPESTEDESQEESEESEELDPKEEARRRYEERQRAKDESKQKILEQTQDYIQGTDDETEQRLRTIEVNDYMRTVESNQNSLIGEFERAKANPDLQIFNPENKEQFNERLYNKAIQDYNAGYLDYDRFGNIQGVKGSLYEHLTEMAALYTDAVKDGQVQQVRATRRMRSSADTKPAAPPKEAQKDPIMEILSSD